ncbi:MAG: SCP2 sterol-binding domain-containing protein [Chloroflexota bacterium]
MTEEQPEKLPLAPSNVRSAALTELHHLTEQVAKLSADDFRRPSGLAGGTVGDVAARLLLSLQLYGQVLDALGRGKGRGVWKALGQVSKVMAPLAEPAAEALGSAGAKLVSSTLPPDTLKSQIAGASSSLRQKMLAISPEDYGHDVVILGHTWPLSYFLALVTNELALRGWDIGAAFDPQARLSEEARSVLPWFYWGGKFMVRAGVSGTIQVRLADPGSEMWWKLQDGKTEVGVGEIPNPDVTIVGQTGTFILALAGRIPPLDALRFAALEVEGKEELAREFLGSWKL